MYKTRGFFFSLFQSVLCKRRHEQKQIFKDLTQDTVVISYREVQALADRQTGAL